MENGNRVWAGACNGLLLPVGIPAGPEQQGGPRIYICLAVPSHSSWHIAVDKAEQLGVSKVVQIPVTIPSAPMLQQEPADPSEVPTLAANILSKSLPSEHRAR